MFLSALMLVASSVPLSSKVEVSPSVEAVVAKYGKEFGDDAERELKALSEAGDRSAAALLGELLMFRDRAGGPQFARSCDYSEAAGQHASATHNLATCYFTGEGRPRDRVRARELYVKAAEMGYAKAACALGNMLIAGDGGPADPSRGIELCRLAADAGVPDSQADYGGYLLTAQYVPKDAVKARHYLSLAAAQGHANAAFLLGQVHWNGDGTDKDVGEAAKWWRVAYDAGRVDAAALLGRTALTRILPALEAKEPVSLAALDEAKHWFGIAAAEGTDPKERQKAVEMLEALKSLSPAPD